MYPYKMLFRVSSLLTDWFPGSGARLLNVTATGLSSNGFLIDRYMRRNVERLKQIGKFGKILVIGDLNIGDAINLQASISALRDFFPDAQIDYVFNRGAANLIRGNPEISNLWPVLTGMPPNRKDFREIEWIVEQRSYQVVFNFCPFLKESRLSPKKHKIISCSALALILIRNERIPSEKNHIVYQSYQFIHRLFFPFLTPKREKPFKGVAIAISDRAMREALGFLRNRNLPRGKPLILYHSDAPSPFTQVPFGLQVSLLRRLARSPCAILLGSGHVAKDIELKLLDSIPAQERKKIAIIPSSMPIDSYAVLIDCSDVFITADTGPLHIGAARKFIRFKDKLLRNKTAIFSIFGATPARIYGYSSRLPGFFPANQDAPSRVYVGKSPCRNITCINKMAKTCKSVRCFRLLDTEEIAADIEEYLGTT